MLGASFETKILVGKKAHITTFKRGWVGGDKTMVVMVAMKGRW
jgi:hypothetical protein